MTTNSNRPVDVTLSLRKMMNSDENKDNSYWACTSALTSRQICWDEDCDVGEKSRKVEHHGNILSAGNITYSGIILLPQYFQILQCYEFNFTFGYGLMGVRQRYFSKHCLGLPVTHSLI